MLIKHLFHQKKKGDYIALNHNYTCCGGFLEWAKGAKNLLNQESPNSYIM